MQYILYLYTGHCKRLQAILKADSQMGLQDLIDTAEFMKTRLCKDEIIIIYDNSLKKELKRYNIERRYKG